MANNAYIKNLIDYNGDTIYPQTKTNAIFNENGSLLSDSLLGFALKTERKAVTLLASNWDTTTKIYSFETEYPNDSYNLTVFLNGDDVTDEQFEAWNNLSAVGSFSRNIITAKNTVPTVDIPVVLEITQK